MPEYTAVTSIEYLEDEADMYDITVEGDHSYLLGTGVVSHNSVMANHLALHQARLGNKIALVSLEMSRKEVIRRLMSSLTLVPLSRINNSKDLTRDERRTLIDGYHDYHERVRKNGGRLTVITPDDDVAIEDILTTLRPRGFDSITIDYVGLLKGMDGDDQWRRLGAAARYGKRYTAGDNSIVTLLAQLSEEGILRYSRTMQEHASLMWTFTRTQQERESGIITVKQPKARNLKSFDFPLATNYAVMRLENVDPAQYERKSKREPSGPKRGGRVSTQPETATEDGGEYQL